MSEERKQKLRGKKQAPRQSKAEKIEGSAEAQEWIKRLRKRTPYQYQSVIDRIEKGSRSEAVRLNCLECSGWAIDEVRNCPCIHCAMYFFRPYQEKEELEEKGEQDETEEDVL